jgi:RimJ/RimL family protein N-acetyltransferase
MDSLKKLGLLIKLAFRSVFGTTHGLRNVEREVAYILDGHGGQAGQLNLDLVAVRDLEDKDISSLIHYWYHSPPGFIESMGVDPKKLIPEQEMEANLRKKVWENRSLPQSKLNVLAITYNGRTIGNHVINPLTENEDGIFHAHIWLPEMRRKGVGMRSYVLAGRTFIERFNLKRILYKTPTQNTGSIRLKEKLGFRYIGEETIGFGVVKDGTQAKVFELTRDDLAKHT